MLSWLAREIRCLEHVLALWLLLVMQKVNVTFRFPQEADVQGLLSPWSPSILFQWVCGRFLVCLWTWIYFTSVGCLFFFPPVFCNCLWVSEGHKGLSSSCLSRKAPSSMSVCLFLWHSGSPCQSLRWWNIWLVSLWTCPGLDASEEPLPKHIPHCGR